MNQMLQSINRTHSLTRLRWLKGIRDARSATMPSSAWSAAMRCASSPTHLRLHGLTAPVYRRRVAQPLPPADGARAPAAPMRSVRCRNGLALRIRVRPS